MKTKDIELYFWNHINEQVAKGNKMELSEHDLSATVFGSEDFVWNFKEKKLYIKPLNLLIDNNEMLNSFGKDMSWVAIIDIPNIGSKIVIDKGNPFVHKELTLNKGGLKFSFATPYSIIKQIKN